jgi:hypothetical protein
LNGDGRDDVLATWSAYGTYYWDTLGRSWVYVSTRADSLAAGDIDGDGTDDLIGTWKPAAYQGLWVKCSSTMNWNKIVLNIPTDIDAGVFSGVAWDLDAAAYQSIQEPIGVGTNRMDRPESLSEYEDFSEEGPGGWNFVYQKEGNHERRLNKAEELKRVPGPGEAGFTCIEQKNLVPHENPGKERNR